MLHNKHINTCDQQMKLIWTSMSFNKVNWKRTTEHQSAMNKYRIKSLSKKVAPKPWGCWDMYSLHAEKYHKN